MILTYSIFSISSFLAESARWLISRGEHKKAEKIIRRVAKVNKRQLPSVLFGEKELEKHDVSHE